VRASRRFQNESKPADIPTVTEIGTKFEGKVIGIGPFHACQLVEDFKGIETSRYTDRPLEGHFLDPVGTEWIVRRSGKEHPQW
jgi:hypothetical protein